jgi:hypothetical protein
MPNKTKDPGATASGPGNQNQVTQSGPGPQPGGGSPPWGFAQNVILEQARPTVIDTGAFLSREPRLTVAFPPCTDELLALINLANPPDHDDITRFFTEYFRFCRHQIFGQYLVGSPAELKNLEEKLPTVLDSNLLACPECGPVILSNQSRKWPTECCLCSPCVTLDGNRNELPPQPAGQPIIPGPGGTVPSIKRLFVGDLLWLFYFDKMGIFQILGAILDSFAYSGRLPISNGSIDRLDIRDDVTALILEVMVRQTKMGMSSAVRDRGSAYRNCLSWVTEPARKLKLDTELNSGFNNMFHKLIYNALEFYKARRLAIAIQGAAAPVAGSLVATLITVSDTIDVLKKRFETFAYGRNYYNTLSGIVWAIAGMSIIRELRTTLGIAPAYGDPHEYIPAAYDLLVMKRPVTYAEMNRYDVHRTCAENGRDILLDLEIIDHRDTAPRGELENWLTQVEGKFEAYRTAYRTLTGVDLGASATPLIEQQA